MIRKDRESRRSERMMEDKEHTGVVVDCSEAGDTRTRAGEAATAGATGDAMEQMLQLLLQERSRQGSCMQREGFERGSYKYEIRTYEPNRDEEKRKV